MFPSFAGNYSWVSTTYIKKAKYIVTSKRRMSCCVNQGRSSWPTLGWPRNLPTSNHNATPSWERPSGWHQNSDLFSNLPKASWRTFSFVNFSACSSSCTVAAFVGTKSSTKRLYRALDAMCFRSLAFKSCLTYAPGRKNLLVQANSNMAVTVSKDREYVSLSSCRKSSTVSGSAVGKIRAFRRSSPSTSGIRRCNPVLLAVSPNGRILESTIGRVSLCSKVDKVYRTLTT